MDPFELIEEKKISRFFRSRKKLCHAGLISHITQRAAGKDILFIEDEDYLAMLGLMKELSGKYEISVYAFCLMPNHIHMLVRPSKDNLFDFMRDLCGRYAAHFNKRYERRGHLFGGPFRQSVVLDETYLIAVSLYIHLNPLNADIVRDPREFRYSSLQLYINDNPPNSFIDTDFVLSFLSDKPEEKRQRYKELIGRGLAFQPGNVLENESVVVRFMTSIKNFLPKSSKTPILYPEINIPSFYNIKKMKRPESMKAKKYLIEQLLARGYTRTQVAEHLNISRKTVFNILTYEE